MSKANNNHISSGLDFLSPLSKEEEKHNIALKPRGTAPVVFNKLKKILNNEK